MFFQKITNKKVIEAIKKLSSDKEFHKIINEDKTLDALEDEKFNPAECYKEFKSLLGMGFEHNGKHYNDLTLLDWAYLWNISNNVVKEQDDKITLLDIDIFLYILENGVKITNTRALTAAAAGYCEMNQITPDDAVQIISIAKYNAFSPLKLFPQKDSVGYAAMIYDSDWLTSRVACVHTVTGYTPDYIMRNMSMTECCYYYIQYARQQGAKDIERRPEQEILELMDLRMCELIVEQLIKYEVIKEKDKQKFIDLISTNPNK